MAAQVAEELLNTMREVIPLGRFAQPEEIASAIVWLAADTAAYVNGAIIPVDGGIGMGH